MAIYKGYWKCPYCTNRNDGPVTVCGCGKARDKDVEFKLDDSAPVVTNSTELREAKVGANKFCSYCNGSYPATLGTCPSCASGAVGGTLPVGDYVPDRSKVKIEKPRAPYSGYSRSFYSSSTQKSYGSGGRSLMPWLIGGGGILFVIAILFFLFSTSDVRSVNITKFSWEKEIYVNQLRTFTESDWDVPSGGRVIDRDRRVKDHEQVVAGYRYDWEDEPYEDGVDKYVCGKTNLGNGYFEDKICKKPIIKNRRKQIKVPIMEDRSIYATWYTFKIDRWVHGRTLKLAREDRFPVWPDLVLSRDEKEDSRLESYSIFFRDDKGKTYERQYPEIEWRKFDPNIRYVGEFNRLGMLGKIKTLEAQ